jgi:manganese/zinc/iron transport system substrate-binding protein
MFGSERRGDVKSVAVAVLVAVLTAGCGKEASNEIDGSLSSREIKIVATTSMVTDLVERVGGERVDVEGLMGPGVDPHLYKASEGDVIALAGADAVFYNGLHLEAKLAEVFERMEERIHTYAVTDQIDRARLLAPPAFAGNYDPHVWFDVGLWRQALAQVRDDLSALDPAHATTYRRNAARYDRELAELDRWVRAETARVAAGKRVLVTAHDAFNYFGRAYGFDVRGLQGISTASEAGTADVRELAAFIAERRIPALFVESSVSPRAIQAVREAVRARGFDVAIGERLFSDAMGDPGMPEGTYPGMVRHNVRAIVSGLLGESDV